MTLLTFGNHLKFGQDSCHTSKGRQIPSSTKRESTQSSMQTTWSLRRASNGSCVCRSVAVVGGRTKARRQFFPIICGLSIDNLPFVFGMHLSSNHIYIYIYIYIYILYTTVTLHLTLCLYSKSCFSLIHHSFSASLKTTCDANLRSFSSYTFFMLMH